MSTLRVNNLKSRTGTAVTITSGHNLDVEGGLNVTGNSLVTGVSTFSGITSFTNGANVTGVTTFEQASFANNGNFTGILTATTFSGNITGVAATFTGVVTYEDVTNVDSVGVVTARQGIRVGAGKSIGSDSGTVTYYGDGSNLTGVSATPTTTRGDIIYRGASADQRLAKGSSGQVLTMGANDPAWAAAASGKIVRVYQGSTSSSIQTNSTSYADIGLTKTLTPQSSSNTFLIQFNMGVMRKTASTTASVYTRLIIPGGNVTWGSGYQLYYHGTDNNTDRGEPPGFWQFIHAPATTSSIEYKVQWKAENTSGNGFYLYGHRQMIIWELEGGVD